MATEKKFLSLTGLTEYNENVMTEIAEGDSNTLTSAKSYTDSVVGGKANASHTHDDRYYTETEIDSKLSAINGAISDIEDGTTVVPKATHAVNADSATSATSATKAEQDDSGDIISEKYETKSDANSKLEAAKTYADNAAATVKNDLLNGAGAAYDTLKELGDLIDDNQDAIEVLETVAAGKADSVHSHAITDVTGLQTALDNKADASHGIHVTFDSTNKPKMDGTAAFGTSTSVARADHVHPTDTSRAAKTDLDSHTGNTTIHITSEERTKWNTASTTATAAKTAADAAQATADSKADAGHTHSYAGSSSAGGAADSANILNSDTRLTYGWNGVNYFNISGTAGNAAGTNDTPTTAWWHIMRFNHANATGYYTDLAIPFNATSLYYKRIAGGTVQNSGWVKVLDSLNYSDYCAPASHTHNYVPYSSGVGTVAAGLNISSNGAYIYSDSSNPGNIYFRYTASSGASHSYANLASIISGINSKLPLSGGSMTGAIKSLRGTYTSIESNRYGNSALEIRENGAVGSAQSDIGYAPSIGFHWSGKCAGTLVLDSSARFQFINQAGGNATVIGGTIRAISSLNSDGTCAIKGACTVGGNVTCGGLITSAISSSGGGYINLTSTGAVGIRGRVTVPPSGDAGIRPDASNTHSCGHASYLWSVVYAKTTTISKSDRKDKKDIRSFDTNENYENLFFDLKPVVYKFKDGTSGRDHFGYISQDVEESLYKYGFDDKSFAGFCRDVKVDENEKPVLDENGNEQWLYSLRYEEFISLNTYMIQKSSKRIDYLEAENNELKARIEKLEKIIEGLCA